MRGYHWGAPQAVWVLSLLTTPLDDDMALANTFELRSEAYLRNASFSRTYGIPIERLHARSFTFGSHVRMDTIKHREVK